MDVGSPGLIPCHTMSHHERTLTVFFFLDGMLAFFRAIPALIIIGRKKNPAVQLGTPMVLSQHKSFFMLVFLWTISATFLFIKKKACCGP